jgi:membrane protein YdbS with pleckstrin-like domain
MKELDKILNKNEKVFWEGKPEFGPFMIGSIILAIIGIGCAGPFFALFLFGGIVGLIAFAVTIGWLFVLIIFVVPLYNFLVYRHVYYAITNKRIILQGGLIGRDFTTVDFDQITNAEVNVGISDKLFSGNTGSIRISTAGSFTQGKYGPVQTPYVLRNVTDPYKVFKFFKKVAHDVKTDIHYPNKYRPNTNPGYRTSYRPKGKTQRKRKK